MESKNFGKSEGNFTIFHSIVQNDEYVKRAEETHSYIFDNIAQSLKYNKIDLININCTHIKCNTLPCTSLPPKKESSMW